MVFLSHRLQPLLGRNARGFRRDALGEYTLLLCVPHALLRARDVWDACAALKRRDLAIGARAGAQRIGAPRRGGRRGARGGVGRARTGRLRERPSRRGVGLSAARAPRRAALLRRRQPLFRAGAWRRAAAGVAGSFGGAAFIPPTRARPPARPPSGLAPPQARERSPAVARTSYLSSPGGLTAHGALGCSPPPPRVPRRHACPLS